MFLHLKENLGKKSRTISWMVPNSLVQVAPWSGGGPGLWDFAGEFHGHPPKPKAGDKLLKNEL